MKHARHRMRTFPGWGILVLLCIFVVLGCGSGKGTSRPMVIPDITVNWAERSRAEGPSAALLARVTVFDVDTSGRDHTFIVNRPAGAAAVSKKYNSDGNIQAGQYNFRIEFLAGPGQESAVVAFATGTATIAANHTSLFTVTNQVNNIVRVQVDPGQQVMVGQTKELAFQVFDASDQQIAVTPGSALFSLVSPSPTIATLAGDSLTGVASGSVGVISEVNGVRSPAETVAIIPCDTDGPEIPTPTSGRITGQVVDPNGNPLLGVAVRTTDGVTVATTTTGADGAFLLENVPAGQRVVTFSQNGRITSAEVAVVSRETVTLSVTLNPFVGTPISGLPVVNLSPINVNQTNGTAIVEGSVTNMDSDVAILLVNGGQIILPLGFGGAFRQTVVLRSGENTIQVEATNAFGTTQSPIQRVSYNATFLFRVTLNWDGSGDIDLHTFAPNNEHSYFANKGITSGELDVDNTSAAGPENFTARSLVPGRYRIAANAYSRATSRQATIAITYTQNGQAVTRALGPFRFTDTDGGSGLPISGNTAAWWRPCDVVVDASGNIQIENPDSQSIGSSRSILYKLTK